MKKWLKIILIVASVLAFVPALFACTKSSGTIELKQPSFLTVQNEDGKKLLVTDNNVYASGYRFGISENSNALNLSLSTFLTYETEAPYLDVTNVFTMPKTYYFYVVALGAENYSDSAPTEILSFDNKYVLGTPSLLLQGTNLSWTEINNATDYSVYCNDVFVVKTLSTFYDFSALVKQAIPYTFKVVANGESYFTSSDFSPTTTFNAHLLLGTPANLSINSNMILSWNAVNNATNYSVLLNGQSIVASTNRMDLSSYIQDVGEYYIQVKSNGYSNYLGSDYSDGISYTNYQTLNTPGHLMAKVNGTNLELSWFAVENAASYTLTIDGEVYSSILFANSVAISFEDLGITQASELYGTVFSVKANAIGYYYASAETTLTYPDIYYTIEPYIFILI